MPNHVLILLSDCNHAVPGYNTVYGRRTNQSQNGLMVSAMRAGQMAVRSEDGAVQLITWVLEHEHHEHCMSVQNEATLSCNRKHLDCQSGLLQTLKTLRNPVQVYEAEPTPSDPQPPTSARAILLPQNPEVSRLGRSIRR